MAGKAYTMREMKTIVEYLTDRKAYGELRGRKMWMEYANSDKTKRTWQSLKETFLKRILPDIQNPYYKLTMDQVRSFRQGIDVAEKEKNNRLEFRIVEENLNAQDQNRLTSVNKDNAVPTTSREIEQPLSIFDDPPHTSIDDELEKVTGEDIKAAKITSRCRSSAETLVLEYENAEDVQRILESPTSQPEPKTKSLKDKLIFEYSAPLTPLVKDLLAEFETESGSSDSEPRLNIDEDQANNIETNDLINDEADSTIEIHDTENLDSTELNGEVIESTVSKEVSNENQIQDNEKSVKSNEVNSQNDKNEHNNNNEIDTGKHNNKDAQQDDNVTIIGSDPKSSTLFVTAESHSKDVEKNADAIKNNTDCSVIANTGSSTQNTSDTLLPNNQEALDGAKTEMPKTKSLKTANVTDKAKKKPGNKRSISKDSKESKKLKLTNEKSNEANDETSAAVIEIVDSPSPIILENNSEKSNLPIIEINSNAQTTQDTEEQFNKFLEQTIKTADKASTRAENNDSSKTEEKNTTVTDKNPCLMSVSLFDEQFKNTKYSDSDSDDATKQKQIIDKPQARKNKVTKTKDATKEAIAKNISQEVKDGLKKAKDFHQKSRDVPQKAKDVPQKAKDVPQTAKEVPREAKDKVAEVVTEKNTTAVVTIENDSNLDSSVDLQPSLQRERAIANVFGFTHGFVASSSRKRRLSHRRKSHHRHHQRHSKNRDSDSSEWTSESDSDSYVSPPRARKNRQTKKFMKPKLNRILQDPEDGMLYVLFGKNVYPLVKDGRHVKNFLLYKSDSDSNQEETFWKQKYKDEKRRVEEVRKLLKDAQRGNTANTSRQMNESIPTTALRNGTNTRSSHRSDQIRNDNAITPEVENKVEAKDDKMVLKIAGCNGLQYSLEGGWNQISNAMPQVMRLLSETASDNGNSKKNGSSEQSKDDQIEVSSRASTPVLTIADKEVQEKVNKVETEIFNEIKILEERQKEKEAKEIEMESSNSNITKRKRGRPSKSSSTVDSPAKRVRSKTNSRDSIQKKPISTRASKVKTEIPNGNLEENAKIDEIKENPNMTTDNAENKVISINKADAEVKEDEFVSARSNSRSSKQKEKSEQNASLENPTLGSRSSSRLLRTPKKYDTDRPSNADKQRPTTSKAIKLSDFDDENARYMFPSKSDRKTTERKLGSLPAINIIPPQDSVGDSIDTAVGYEDSDPSPMKVFVLKRKRKVSFTARNRSKTRRLSRRSCPLLLEGPVSDSNNSSYFIPLRKSPASFSSTIYRSDSFQLMMPKRRQSMATLERIDENDPSQDPNKRHFNSISNSNKSSENDIILEYNSSSVSLPVSPELSVVETMSVSREMIKDVEHPTINEVLQNVPSQPMDYSEYMISNLDVSVPLMAQRCQLRKSPDGVDENANKYDSKSPQLRDETVNLTASETLDRRLKELLLESTKKPSPKKNTQTPMEVDQTIVTAKKPRQRKQKSNVAMDVDKSKETRKTRAKKRSSTPQKKKVVPKSKAPKDAVIEEEHTESCIAGRKSCPPVITFIPMDESANNPDATPNPTVNPKKKKDIIKVKIQKPKKSRSQENIRGKSVGNGSVASNCTDSGINDTETISLVLKDSSVDLIHNHSETCLQAHECIESDSVEFIQTSPALIISLSSSGQCEDSDEDMIHDDTPDIQDGQTEENQASEAKASDEVFQSPETRFQSPETMYQSPHNSISSLITEDLSNSPPTPPTKWYILDEDITNADSGSHAPSFGSNLNQIFPITCAVPNLSTISEASKDCEDNRKTGG